jgi:GH43 family beta-xylosidase
MRLVLEHCLLFSKRFMSSENSAPSQHLLSPQAVAAALVSLGAPTELPASIVTPPALPPPSQAAAPFHQAALVNPIFPAPSADPWVVQHCGIWYALLAYGRTLQLRAAPLLSELRTVEPITVWRAPESGLLSRNIWAPELHFLDGRWFIYLTGDDGNNDNHRMWVLEAETPLGPWRNRGKIETGGWAIDGTVLEESGRRYFIWSGWPGHCNGQQNLYLAEMRNPWTLAGPRVLLSQPDQPWERVAMPLCEGPQLLRRDGRTFIVYSASGSWTDDYCLGMLINEDGDFLNPRSWVKQGPVFKKTERVWGVGHCCFVQHPLAGTDNPLDLIFYHAKTDHAHGWDDRDVRVQPFGWSADGLPEFGEPVEV